MKITKDDYIRYVEDVIAWHKMEDDIDEISDGSIRLWENEYLQRVITNMIDLMEISTDDKDHTLSYFLWELNFGKDWKPGCLTCNGEDIKLQTIEDVWNYMNKGDENGKN